MKSVPIITIAMGFLSFVVLSIYYGVFFLDSIYDVPLILNMSVMIGDSLLLPIINYKLFILYFRYLNLGRPIGGQTLWLILLLLISTILNIYTHVSWVDDEYSDFIGFQQGEFSIIGYWHMIFSIIQMCVLFIYPYLWYRSINIQNRNAIQYSKKIWNYLFLFTFLGTFDMLNKYLFVYNDSLYHTIEREGFPFYTIIIAIILFYIMGELDKQKVKSSRTLPK